MPHPSAPLKTPAGHDELRRRTHGLGQRYRTVLLLVDGRRSVAEVLELAHQAGAQTSHLETLVQLGLVALPQEPASGMVGRPDTGAGESPDAPASMTAGTSAVEPAPAELPRPAEPASADAAATADPLPEPVTPPALATDPVPVPAPASTMVLWSVPGDGDSPAAPAPSLDDERTLAEVRRLLLDTLRRDSLLSRAFAPARVSGARTQDDLIGLVWALERERAHARRNRGQLLKLQRARELLGMGNTLVAGDSLPAPPADP